MNTDSKSSNLQAPTSREAPSSNIQFRAESALELGASSSVFIRVHPWLTSGLRPTPFISERFSDMNRLLLHEFHRALNAQLAELNGSEVVADYGGPKSEHSALWRQAGVLDLSFRSRLCLTGA